MITLRKANSEVGFIGSLRKTHREIKMHIVIYLQILLGRLAKSKAGAVATEYAFLIAFIAIVAAIGMVLLGNNLSAFFNDIGTALTDISANLPEPFNT